MSDYLFHHGILGQKWGVQNGPPYPLDSGDHSAEKKRAGWRASLKKKEFSEKQSSRKVINEKSLSKSSNIDYSKIGKLAAASILAVGGGIILAKNADAIQEAIISGKRLLNSYFGGSAVPRVGKAIKDLDRKMISNINSKYRGTEEGSMNCLHCSIAYIMNSLLGENVTAAPMFGIDEVSGFKAPGRYINLLDRIFENVQDYDFIEIRGKRYDHVKTQVGRKAYAEIVLKEPYGPNSPIQHLNTLLADAFLKVKNGSTGIVMIPGHYLNYEKTSSGEVTLIDCQSNTVQKLSASGLSILHAVKIWDLSNASIKQDAEDILRKMLE